jgi:hypothetical protein
VRERFIVRHLTWNTRLICALFDSSHIYIHNNHKKTYKSTGKCYLWNNVIM